MNIPFDFTELASRPACTLSSIEQFAFNEYCKSHITDAETMLRVQHPTASLSFMQTKPHRDTIEHPQAKEYVYGLKGLAELLNCSIVTASRIKSSGILDKAISQVGRKIVIDKNLCLELASMKKGGLCHA